MLPLSEDQGRAVLRDRFTRAGLDIVADYPFADEGVTVTLDGFDPLHRVGYEYITTTAGDREDLSAAEIGELERRMAAGVLAILLVDELDRLDEHDLAVAADRFLTHLRQMGFLHASPREAHDREVP